VKIAVTECIKSALREGRSVYLYDIGTLHFAPLVGESEDSEVLLWLNRGKKHSNIKLISEMATKYRIKKSQARSALKFYSKSISKSLNRHALASVDGVVVLSKRGNKKIRLTPLNKRWNKSSVSKRDVIQDSAIVTKQKSEKATNSETEKGNEVAKTESHKKKEKPVQKAEFRTAATPSLVQPLDLDKATQDTIEEIKELEKLHHLLPDGDEFKNVLKEHFYQEDDLEPIQQKEPVVTIAPQKKDNTYNKSAYVTSSKAIQGHHIWKRWGAILTTLLIGAVLVFAIYKMVEINQGSKIKTGSIGDSDETIETLPVEEQNIHPEEMASQQLPFSQKCVIITGSFSNSKNQNSMINLLERNGYEVYTEPRGGMTRIGLEFDCSNSDLESYLATIRKKIEPKAWYLYPSQNELGFN
jgi:cell division septation protein DedD